MFRRDFLLTSTGAALVPAARAVYGAATLNHRERVDRAVACVDVDRQPFTLWHHFGLKTAEAHAARTLDFHRRYRTDLVKVMSDFPYPKPAGAWYELAVLDNPFPDQIRALELIRNGLNGDAWFIETVFNPWNVAQKLSSADEVNQLKNENPQRLLDALGVIAKSEINHARRALALGASGILFSVANANSKEMSVEDYAKFSAPFDKQILAALPNGRLNILHLHVEREYLSQFRDFPAPIINYSVAVSGIDVEDVRRHFPQVIMGGIDEVRFRHLTEGEMQHEWRMARAQAGPKYIVAPGCSVPNDSTEDELSRLPKAVGA